MPAFPHTIIRASAGTGKTYQLSSRFIGLACAGEPADHILAATFARKAAGEILDRVLTAVAVASTDATQLQKLREATGDDSLDSERCLTLLQQLLKRLHRLRIGTLDSFFVQLAGTFSLDLGLPPGWRIVDEVDDAQLRRDAVQAVLQNETTSELLTLLNLLFKGEARRSITGQISEIVSTLYDVFRDSSQEAWHALPRWKPLNKEQLATALADLEMIGPFANKTWDNAWNTSRELAAGGVWLEFLGKGLAAKIVAGETMFSRKPIEPRIIDAYQPLIEHARATLINQLADQTEATWRLLDKYHAAYQKLKTSQRAMRFDDVTRTLAEGMSGGRVGEIAYRLDSQVAHLLLDEFQDTSLAQWSVVRPFATRIAEKGSGQSVFCVGDVKQAIYGWRGGVSEVFDAVHETVPGVSSQPLTKSFRSGPVIIEVVNRVLSTLISNKTLAEYSAVAELWKTRYETHTTDKTDLPGHCRLITAPRADDPKNQWEVTLKYAASEVARLAREAPGRSIGVLVRRNAAVARLIYELRTNHQIFASEEGGNPLTDSMAVQLVLSLLKLADHPGDTVARFHISTSPLGPVLGFTEHTDGLCALQLSQSIREQLLTEGYGRTIYRWAEQLAPSCDARECRRLQQLVEHAYAYEDRATLRADDFVRFIEATRVEDPTTADVRVMTVHQAKGLQFDIVVLPELDLPLQGMPPKVVMDRERPTEPIRRVCRYVNKNVHPHLPPDFLGMFTGWPLKDVNESLCLLYVALTRPVYALHLIVAPSKENETTWPKTFAAVLRAALTSGKEAKPEAVLFESGDAAWFEQLSDHAVNAESSDANVVKQRAEEGTIRLRESNARRRRGLETQSPSRLAGGARINLARRLQADASFATIRGSLFHAWFEQILWLDDGLPQEAVLNELARKFITPGLDLDAELAAFHRMTTTPTVARWLSRSAYLKPSRDDFNPLTITASREQPIVLDVWREQPFLVREEDVLLNGFIDRVVLVRHGDRVVAADIIDFKTDAVDEQNVRDVANYYAPQLAAYRRAVERMTGLEPSFVTSRLLFVAAGLMHRAE